MNQSTVVKIFTPVLLLLLLLASYGSSLLSMWQTWGNSETYAHGYLIFPIVAYLIWRKRHDLLQAPQRPSFVACVALGGLGLLWVIGHLLHVQVVEQFLFIAMLLTLFLAFYGTSMFMVILFPLLYLGFAVPMGEVFVPYLMEFTADFTVAALKVTGIPVFRDGMFFTIPSGNFEVAWACSGIRYLMASFSLGTLYAYLSYRSFKKQFVFAVVSLIVPIIANAVRAYGIVIIAHLTDMKYAVGVDHLIYGWLFFGAIMFLLFYVGGRFRSAEDFVTPATATSIAPAVNSTRVWGISAGVIVALLIPQLLLKTTSIAAQSELALSQLPVGTGMWQGPLRETSGFKPELINAEHKITANYAHPNGDVQVWIYRYRPFSADKEMINETNRLVNRKNWRQIDHANLPRPSAEYLPAVNEALMRLGFEEYLVWHWYQLNDTSATSKITGKLMEVSTWLLNGLRLDEAIVILAAPGRGEEARAQLEGFVREQGARLNACIFAVGPQESCRVGFEFE